MLIYDVLHHIINDRMFVETKNERYSSMNLNYSKRYISNCPVGCVSTLVETKIIMAEGNLLRCDECGQLISQCSEDLYWKSMEAYDDPQGTLPETQKIAARGLRRSKKLLDHIQKLLNKKSSDIHILDVGCSSGAFLNRAVTLGFFAEGVEPAPKAVKTAQLAGLNVRQGFLHEVEYANNEFDAVTLFEVIEHIKDPLPLLNEINRILRPGGILLIGTGNAESWTAKVMGANWEYLRNDYHGGHISFYNPKSLAKVASKSGFQVASLKTRSVDFVEKATCRKPFYYICKIASELSNPIAKLVDKGSDLMIYLQKTN